jgi:hypothetical protein
MACREGRGERGEGDVGLERGQTGKRGERREERGTAHVPSVVVWRVRVSAITPASGRVARAVGVRAVVEAEAILTHVAVVSRLAHAARHGVFHRTPAVKGAVGLAVERAAVVA